MRPWIFAVLALASCDTVYGLTGRGGDGSVDSPIDTAQSDGPPSGCMVWPNPLDDEDGDEILNQNDRCPTTPDRGHNEDGDCFGDVCDPCPQFATDTMDADADGDAIGDQCDLEGTSIDVRRFEGFDNGDELELSQGWTLDTNLGQLSTAQNAGLGLYAWANTEITSPFLIETELLIPAGGVDWRIGIVFGATNARDQSPDGWLLALENTVANGMRVRLFQLAAGFLQPTNLDIMAPAGGPMLRLRVVVRGRAVTVSTSSGGMQSEIGTMLPTNLAAETSFGIGGVGDVSTMFEYLYEVHRQQ